MSATVSYKGNTLTTVNNQTRVLNTIGKWLEDDITIVDVTQSSGGTPAISVVDTLDAKGGTVRTITALDISDTTATASDVAVGKYFYTSNGTKTAGASSGGGSSGQSATGTISGNGTNVLEISCNFEPDLIYVYTDMSDDASKRGVASFIIIKDSMLQLLIYGSASNTNIGIYEHSISITGYGDVESIHGTYSNGTLTLTTVGNSSALKFLSGQTYTYELKTLGSSSSSLTRHTIYFEYSDSTDATIYADYNDTFISNAIRATTPTTHNNKVVTLAELDGVAWYEPNNIPIGVELVDYTTVTNNTGIDDSGNTFEQEWCYTSDYIAVDPSMTFTYTAYYWFYIGVYDDSYNVLRTIYAMTDATQDSDNGNIGHGTLSGNKLTGASYVRICGPGADSDNMSLIRTA